MSMSKSLSPSSPMFDGRQRARSSSPGQFNQQVNNNNNNNNNEFIDIQPSSGSGTCPSPSPCPLSSSSFSLRPSRNHPTPVKGVPIRADHHVFGKKKEAARDDNNSHNQQASTLSPNHSSHSSSPLCGIPFNVRPIRKVPTGTYPGPLGAANKWMQPMQHAAFTPVEGKKAVATAKKTSISPNASAMSRRSPSPLYSPSKSSSASAARRSPVSPSHKLATAIEVQSHAIVLQKRAATASVLKRGATKSPHSGSHKACNSRDDLDLSPSFANMELEDAADECARDLSSHSPECFMEEDVERDSCNEIPLSFPSTPVRRGLQECDGDEHYFPNTPVRKALAQDSNVIEDELLLAQAKFSPSPYADSRCLEPVASLLHTSSTCSTPGVSTPAHHARALTGSIDARNTPMSLASTPLPFSGERNSAPSPSITAIPIAQFASVPQLPLASAQHVVPMDDCVSYAAVPLSQRATSVSDVSVGGDLSAFSSRSASQQSSRSHEPSSTRSDTNSLHSLSWASLSSSASDISTSNTRR